MTRKTIVDLVHIWACGGKLGEDCDVWRVDVDAYFPIALTAAIEERNKYNKQQARVDYRLKGYGVEEDIGITEDAEISDGDDVSKYSKIASDDIVIVSKSDSKYMKGIDHGYVSSGKIHINLCVPKKVTITGTLTAGAIGDDMDIPLSGDILDLTVEKMKEHFLGQRKLPIDRISDEDES